MIVGVDPRTTDLEPREVERIVVSSLIELLSVQASVREINRLTDGSLEIVSDGLCIAAHYVRQGLVSTEPPRQRTDSKSISMCLTASECERGCGCGCVKDLGFIPAGHSQLEGVPACHCHPF